MRKRMMFILLLLVLVVSSLSVATASGPAQRYRTVVNDISDYPDIIPIDGSAAQLVTNDKGATLQVRTSELPPGHAVTVWWVIFNHPEHCSGGECGPEDAFPPPGNVAAGASVSFAAGHVIGGDGRGNYGAHIAPGGDAGPWTVGLIDPLTAEYHFALRDHGPADPHLVSEQIHTATAGCNNFPPFTGDYTCADIQGGRFE